MGTGRKIVYVLGAGASYGAGASATVQRGGNVRIPTQADFWRTFLRFCSSNERKKRIQSFLFRYFTSFSRVPARLNDQQRRQLLSAIDVEEVFTFLSERIQAPATTTAFKRVAEQIWLDLTIEIGHVFSRFKSNKLTQGIYKRLVRNQIRSRDSIISFNYDTVFETSVGTKLNWAYRGIEDCTGKVGILKPHGSINWQLQDNEIQRVSNPGEPVIVAPTHLKFTRLYNQAETDTMKQGYLDQSPQIHNVWSEMEKELRNAKAIVFIGYSFPAADLYFSSLLRTTIGLEGRNPAIILVNPDSVALGKRIEQRFSVQTTPFFDLVQFSEIKRGTMLRIAGIDK